jgi:predicted TIM-barrel fold metal-dependent hydrolase
LILTTGFKKIIKKYPNFFGFSTINPKESDAPQKLQKAFKMDLLGAKIHPTVQGITVNDHTIDEFFQVAENLNMPIHIHTGVNPRGFLRSNRPILIDDVAQQHLNLTLILEHIGAYAMFYEALAVLHNNANCYAGLTFCSGRVPTYFLSPDRINVLLKTVGANRIIYGLDYPFNTNNLKALKDDIEWINSWNISTSDKAKILGENIYNLIIKTKDGVK